MKFYKILILLFLISSQARAEDPPTYSVPLKQYSTSSDVSGKSRIKFHFLIENKSDFKKIGIKSVGLCKSTTYCEQAKELNNGFLLKDDQVLFSHSITESGNKGNYLYLKSSHQGSIKVSNPIISLDQPITLEKDYNYDAFIKLEKNSTGNYDAKFMAYGPQSGSEEKTILYEPSKSYSIELNGGFSVAIPKDATSKPVVIGFQTDRKLTNNGWLQIIPDISFNRAISVQIKFNFKNKTSGNEKNSYQAGIGVNNFNASINGVAADLKHVKTDGDGNAFYRVETNKSGLFEVLEKDPVEMLHQKSSLNPLYENISALTTGTCVNTIKSIGNTFSIRLM